MQLDTTIYLREAIIVTPRTQIPLTFQNTATLQIHDQYPKPRESIAIVVPPRSQIVTKLPVNQRNGYAVRNI